MASEKIDNHWAFSGFLVTLDMNWYSTAVCPCCHYDLELDLEGVVKGEWQHQTGCPKCFRSFVE